jgi:hypothetical protein
MAAPTQHPFQHGSAYKPSSSRILKISPESFNEIKRCLEESGYELCITRNGLLIHSLTGLALAADELTERPSVRQYRAATTLTGGKS